MLRVGVLVSGGGTNLQAIDLFSILRTSFITLSAVFLLARIGIYIHVGLYNYLTKIMECLECNIQVITIAISISIHSKENNSSKLYDKIIISPNQTNV